MATTVPPAAAAPAAPDELFGHPRGLTVLGATEMWERFSFVGMQALLMLYMTKYLLLPENARGVIGLAGFRSGLESLTGPLTDLAFAGQTYGLYSALIYLSPIGGAWLGDRVLGRTRTVTLGCAFMAAGHTAMASEALFLGALALLIVGAGCLIGNLAAQIGALYSLEDERRTRAFGVYLLVINLGAFLAPLVIGTLGEKVSWHLGFGAAGVGMMLGLIIYLTGRRHLPPDTIVRGVPRSARARLTRSEWGKIWVILLMLFVPYMLYGVAIFQSYGVMFVWADKAVDRTILGFELPVTWIYIFDSVATITGIALGNKLSVVLSRRRGRDLAEVTKLVIGTTGVTIAWLFISAVGGGTITPIALWILFYILQDFSYAAFIEPQTYSIVSRDSPPATVSMMMAMLKASAAVSYFLAGWMVRFYEPLGAQKFFLLVAAVAGSAAAIMIVAYPWWLRRLGPPHAEPPVEIAPFAPAPDPLPAD